MTDPSFRPKARAVRGFPDKRAATLATERGIVERVLALYESWGFERLETPSFEYADALGKFLPDQERPNAGVFALEDDDSQWMALRYDLTAPLARFAAENWDSLPKPFRRCAAGPVWRNEKPGPGRFREFWQCDADTVGSASAMADAEMIAIAAAAMAAAGLPEGSFVIRASSRRLLDAAMQGAGLGGESAGAVAARLTALRALDKLDRLGPEGVAALLTSGRRDESGDFTPGAGLGVGEADRLLGFVASARTTRSETLNALEASIGDSNTGQAGLTELSAIDSALTALGVPSDRAIFDPSVVRGLEYYTGAVFEAELTLTVIGDDGNPMRFGSVGGGGRYDDLVSRFRGEAVPSTGFSVGVSRLAAALQAAGKAQRVVPGPVVILALDTDAAADYLGMAAELRSAGIAAEVYLGASGMRAQMKYADKRNAPIAVIMGGDERARGEVTLKDLALGAELARTITDNKEWREGRPAQLSVPRAELVARVRAMLDPA